MKKWLPAIVLVCVAAALCVNFIGGSKRTAPVGQDSPPAPDRPTPTTTATNQTISEQTQTNAVASIASAKVVSPQATPSAIPANEPPFTPIELPEPSVPEAELPQLPASTVLENVRSVFRHFQSKFDGNPVGTNHEITRALNGENQLQIRFLRMEDGMRVNARGELIDTWGTAYFFHQLSGTEMEIHSAGPDKQMWTSDDLVIK